MFQRILVPLDGSQRAERAVPVAGRVARVSGGSLVLLQVLSAPSELLPFVAPALEPSTLSADESAAMNYLKTVATLAPGVSSELAVRTGLAANMIASFADTSHVDAICMTSHGQSNIMHRLWGSVAERVAHTSPAPVLVLRETIPSPADGAAGGQPEPESYLRVLVPLDGTPAGEAALAPSAMLAAALSSPGQGALGLVRVIPTRATAADRAAAEAYLKDVIARLRASTLAALNVSADWAIAQGTNPANLLVQIATNTASSPREYNLVALATPPAKRANHWPFDHVIDRLLRSTKVSLLLVHPPEAPVPERPASPS